MSILSISRDVHYLVATVLINNKTHRFQFGRPFQMLLPSLGSKKPNGICLWMTKTGRTQKIPTVLCRTSYTHIDYSIHQIIHSSHACKVELLVYVSILPAWGSLKSATNFLTATAQYTFFCQIQSNSIGNPESCEKVVSKVERSASVDIKIIENFKNFKSSPINRTEISQNWYCALSVPRISLGIKPDQLWPCAYWTLNKNVGLGWVCEFKVSCWVFFVWVRKKDINFRINSSPCFLCNKVIGWYFISK